jgi:hypothetical protein
MRRKVSAADWKYPRRMTFSQWRRLGYRQKYWIITQMQCTLLGYWKDCRIRRCRRQRKCYIPDPCYWDHKSQMSREEWARAAAQCQPLRKLLHIGSSKGSEGLWLF